MYGSIVQIVGYPSHAIAIETAGIHLQHHHQPSPSFLPSSRQPPQLLKPNDVFYFFGIFSFSLFIFHLHLIYVVVVIVVVDFYLSPPLYR